MSESVQGWITRTQGQLGIGFCCQRSHHSVAAVGAVVKACGFGWSALPPGKGLRRFEGSQLPQETGRRNSIRLSSWWRLWWWWRVAVDYCQRRAEASSEHDGNVVGFIVVTTQAGLTGSSACRPQSIMGSPASDAEAGDGLRGELPARWLKKRLGLASVHLLAGRKIWCGFEALYNVSVRTAATTMCNGKRRPSEINLGCNWGITLPMRASCRGIKILCDKWARENKLACLSH